MQQAFLKTFSRFSVFYCKAKEGVIEGLKRQKKQKKQKAEPTDEASQCCKEITFRQASA